MLILLDNYDSFTYNLYQYLAELGSAPRVIRNDELTVAQLLALAPTGIILSPGPGRPEKAGIMNDLIREAAKRTVPLLGVCLGHQGIGQVFGASIVHAPTIMHGKISSIRHDQSRLYQDVPNPFAATRYHSLVIDPPSLPGDFFVTATTDDDVIMGIQHRTLPIYGVQYHPESIMTIHGKTVLANFLATLP